MYCITDQQIDYILRDIRARGVEMEALQNDLLDHVCCIIEQQLEANGDFERFYEQTIRRFYTHHLWEIEEETMTLQLFKHYYAMKKTMIASGVVSAITIVVGALFKINHWPGANISLTLGLGVLSLLFLPLLFILRIREKSQTRDKAILVFGLITGMMAGVGALFKLLHWPFGDLIKDVTLYTLMLGFVPVYFFTGIRRPENRVNTIVTSILLLITGGMLLTLTSVKPSLASNEAVIETIADNERLVAQLEAAHHAPSVSTAAALQLCGKLKARLTQAYTGYSKADGLSAKAPLKLNDASAYHMLRNDDGTALTELQQLHQNLARYKPASNLSLVKDLDRLSADDWYNAHFFNCNYSDALVKLTQVQVLLLTQP